MNYFVEAFAWISDNLYGSNGVLARTWEHLWYTVVSVVLASVVAIPLGLWLGNGPVEKILLILAPALVLSAELLNSAIEAVVDKVSPEFHELAGRAKDMGSAAVFVLLMLVVVSWALILVPRFL